MNAQYGQNETKSSVGIIGGGRVGLQFFQLFKESSLTEVVYVVDRDAQAPAMLAAQEKGVAAITDLNQALQMRNVDFIVEVTGSASLVEKLKQSVAGDHVQVITHDMAFILLKVIEESRQRTTSLVRSDILDIQKGIAHSLNTIDGAINSIKETTSDLHYLVVNARIEAAHAGEFGRGFDIVAQQVERSAQEVRDMAQKIQKVNEDISSIAGRIEASLQNLR